MVALESALPPLRVAAKRLRFTPSSSSSSKRKRVESVAGAGGGGCSESQLLADIAVEGAVSCSTDVAAAAPDKPGADTHRCWLAALQCLEYERLLC